MLKTGGWAKSEFPPGFRGRSVSRVTLGFGFLVLILLESCAKPPPPSLIPPPPGLRSQKPYQVHGIWYYPLPSAEGYVEEGIASWYGTECHGKPTSSGEPFDMNAMTAAHKTLPLGTYVKVTDLKTRRSVILRVNDRGPFVAGRIIDLSHGAARELGTAGRGLAVVRVEAVQIAQEQYVGQNLYWRVDPVPSFRYGTFAVQVGSFKDPDNAYRLKNRMAKAYNQSQVATFCYRGENYYRVQVGIFQDLVLAQQEVQQLRGRGFPDAFVVATEGN